MTTRTTKLLRTHGAVALLTAGVPARLPMAAYGIGLLAIGRDRYGSLAIGGILAACYTTSAIIGGWVIGARIGRPGFARSLLLLCSIHLAAIAALAAVAHAAVPTAAVAALSAVVGLTVAPAGVITRAQWPSLVPVDAVGRAMLLESAADEAVFLVGPVLVTSLGQALGAEAALMAVGCVTALGGASLASRMAGPARSRPAESRSAEAAPIPLITAFLLLGWAFAGIQVAAFGIAASTGRPADAGWMLTVFSLISLLSTLLVARWVGPDGRRQQVTGFAVLAVGLIAPSIGAHSAIGFVALSSVAAAACAPTVAAGFRRVAGSARPATLAWAAAALSTGLAIGAAVCGRLVEVAGASAVLLTGTATALIGAVLASRPMAWERS